MKLALILARSGSKRIPNKNMVEICGKPLLYYPITAALRSGEFDEIVVSSDGFHILEYAESLGVHIHNRKAELSGDKISAFEVVQKILNQGDLSTKNEDIVTVMYGSSVFVTPGHIIEMLSWLSEYDMVFSATEFTFPPQRGFECNDNLLVPINKSAFLKRSQDLNPWFHDVGQIYVAKHRQWIKAKTIYDGKSTFYKIKPNEVQDIDNYLDLELAELKLKRML